MNTFDIKRPKQFNQPIFVHFKITGISYFLTLSSLMSTDSLFLLVKIFLMFSYIKHEMNIQTDQLLNISRPNMKTD